MVSKKAIYNLIPKILSDHGAYKRGVALEIKTTIEQAFIQYPFFVKPDIGLRAPGKKN
jgi:hypothetical protein